LMELTFYGYPHELENLLFNLAPVFFLCSQGLKANMCWSPSIFHTCLDGELTKRGHAAVGAVGGLDSAS
jgi:hypothetical protein